MHNLSFITVTKVILHTLQLESGFPKTPILSICRAKPVFVTCCDMDTDCVVGSENKQCLITLLTCSNHACIVDLPPRIQNYSSSVTHNIFRGFTRKDNINNEFVSDHLQLQEM